MDFHELKGTFAVWVQAPSPACHFFEFTEEVESFLLHEDGANLQMSQVQLQAAFNDESRWQKDADGHLFSWSIQVGFTSVFLFMVSPVPTLLQKSLLDIHCRWCGEYHKGGPENCQ